MDPLSIATGCITLIIAVSDCTRSIKTFVLSCRDAQKDLAALSRELSDLDMTLHILKNDTEANESNQLPATLRQRIRDIMDNCNGALEELKTLLGRYEGAGLQSSAKWAISGKKDTEKIRASLQAHKGALGLVVEATTLHMTKTVAADTKAISKDTSLLKEYTMKIVEQLAKQDEILEQIAWIRALVTQKSGESDQESTLVMDSYLDSMSEYTGSVCGDSVSDDVAEEMRKLSLETPNSSGGSSSTLLNPFEPEPVSMDDEPEMMTIVIGNTHRLVGPKPERSSNKHLWSFYLQASGEEIIQEVAIDLHPTFMPPKLKLRTAPYRVTRIGWGYFTIGVAITLKPGYAWHLRGKYDRTLYLDWELDFNGFGSSASYEFPVSVGKDALEQSE